MLLNLSFIKKIYVSTSDGKYFTDNQLCLICKLQYIFYLLDVSKTPAMTLTYIDNKYAYWAANKIQI